MLSQRAYLILCAEKFSYLFIQKPTLIRVMASAHIFLAFFRGQLAFLSNDPDPYKGHYHAKKSGPNDCCKFAV